MMRFCNLGRVGEPCGCAGCRASRSSKYAPLEFQLVQKATSMLRMYCACAFTHAALVAAGPLARRTALAVAGVALDGSIAFARWAVLHLV
jgi:hypothetical protein